MMQNPRIFYCRYSFILKSGIACDIINKMLILSKCNLYNLLQLTQKYKKGLLFMVLTKEQQALLDGEKGETMAKVMKTLVMYGEAFGAERMVPVTSKYGHTVISFGIGVSRYMSCMILFLKPVLSVSSHFRQTRDRLIKTCRHHFCRTLYLSLCTVSKRGMSHSSNTSD